MLVLVRRLRDAIVERVRRWWPDVRASLAALRASHKLALLLLGSLATELLFAIALGLFARSFGSHVDLAELLVINISVSLLASFIPVPGGIGVAEFGLTVGLDVGRHDPGGGDRGRPALPDRDLLPAAGLGLPRHALAPAQPLPLRSRAMDVRAGIDAGAESPFVSTGELPSAERVQLLVAEAHERYRANDDGATSRRSTRRSRGCPASSSGSASPASAATSTRRATSEAELTIMSVAKPFVYALVCEQLGRDELRRLVGVNATGLPFNSLAAVERSGDGRTNPMVNPGAIAVTSLVPGADPEAKWRFIRDGLSRFAGRELALDDEVYASASETNHRNQSLAQLLQEPRPPLRRTRPRRSTSTRGRAASA